MDLLKYRLVTFRYNQSIFRSSTVLLPGINYFSLEKATNLKYAKTYNDHCDPVRASGLFSSCFTRQQEPKTPDAFAGYRHISTHTYFTIYLHYDQNVTKSKESLIHREEEPSGEGTLFTTQVKERKKLLKKWQKNCNLIVKIKKINAHKKFYKRKKELRRTNRKRTAASGGFV